MSKMVVFLFVLIPSSVLLVCVVLSRCMQLLLSPLAHLSARQKCLLFVGGYNLHLGNSTEVEEGEKKSTHFQPQGQNIMIYTC